MKASSTSLEIILHFSATYLSILTLTIATGQISPVAAQEVELSPAASIVQASKTDDQAQADLLRQQGINTAKAGELEQALKLWVQAISLYRQTGDRLGEAHAQRNIGRAHGLLNQHPESLAAYQEALEIDRETQNIQGQEIALDGLGKAAQALEQYDAAQQAFTQALALAQENGDRKREGYYLAKLGQIDEARGHYQAAIEKFEQSLALRQETGSRLGESFALAKLGKAYQSLGQHQRAIAYFEQSLTVEQAIDAKTEAAESLNSLAINYQFLSQYSKAIELLEQSLSLAQELKSPSAEAVALSNLAIVYRDVGEYQRAIKLHQQSMVIEQDLGDILGLVNSFNGLGNVHQDLGDYQKAIGFFEQSLAVGQTLGDRRGEANALGNLGNTYNALGQYDQAQGLHQQSLKLHREISNPRGEASALANLGNTYRSISQYDRALEHLEQALALEKSLNHPQGIANVLGNLASTYEALGQLDRAIEIHGQSLALFIEIGDRRGEAAILSNLSNAYYGLSQFERTIELQQQALGIKQEIGDRAGEAVSLGNLGSTYDTLGQYERAIELHQQSLSIDQAIGKRRGEAAALINLGNAHEALGQYDAAVKFQREAVALNRSIGNRQGEAVALSNLGNSYMASGEYAQSLKVQEQALKLMRAVGDRRGEAAALVNLGAISSRFGKTPDPVIKHFQQALGIAQAVGDRQIAAQSLSALGTIAAEQEQPELAIAFLKNSVAFSETIRTDIQGLTTDLQQSYTETVSDRYRFLANLLLEQGRIPEAQQVLDLLKLEELRKFSQQTRATWTSEGLQYTAAEQRIVDAHGDLIAFGQTLYNCEQESCSQLQKLRNQQKELTQQYDQEIVDLAATIRTNRDADALFNNPEALNRDAQALLAANPNAVLIYPLVTEDKLWLVYATAGGSQGSNVGSVAIDVSQAELSKTVQQLGKSLTREGQLRQLQTISKQLHNWIIEPLETALDQNEIEHLIFVNDRVTRYIPMAALFDGEQYLLERYTVSSVLSPALTDSTSKLGKVDTTQILGLGLTKAVEGFSPLPAVADELDRIIRSDSADPLGSYPGQVHLNDAFTLDQLKADVKDHRVLHIATHANFVPGRPEASYIVLGNGEHWKIPEIDQLGEQLRNLHLVILSACKTALGGKADDGTEIAGLSAYFLAEGRAESVIASLWSVNDNSTSLLMQRFYELMASGELTKAEALKQAQLSLLYDEDSETRLEATRGKIQFAPPAETQQPLSASSGLAHPYYWAPFILIGNGL